MFEQSFKNIDDILYKDSGADSELDYIGQTSWVLFLRYLDDLEKDKADEAALEGKDYEFIVDEKYRWGTWAMPKDATGNLERNAALRGPELVQFVDYELFPYLAGFKEKAKENPKTIEKPQLNDPESYEFINLTLVDSTAFKENIEERKKMFTSNVNSQKDYKENYPSL